jgi:hypothetical protein
MKSTTRLVNDASYTGAVLAPVEGIDLGMVRPWRIALVVKRMQVKLIVDLIDSLIIGRFDGDNNVLPDIDLRPFHAEELGVSRQHLFLKLEGDNVVVIDNESSNGTMLNGRRLKSGYPYPIQHGDEIVLGALEIQIELLINPLEL